jgi:hypothetical protein
VHLVGFILRIYHDAQSSERQIFCACFALLCSCFCQLITSVITHVWCMLTDSSINSLHVTHVMTLWCGVNTNKTCQSLCVCVGVCVCVCVSVVTEGPAGDKAATGSSRTEVGRIRICGKRAGEVAERPGGLAGVAHRSRHETEPFQESAASPWREGK